MERNGGDGRRAAGGRRALGIESCVEGFQLVGVPVVLDAHERSETLDEATGDLDDAAGEKPLTDLEMPAVEGDDAVLGDAAAGTDRECGDELGVGDGARLALGPATRGRITGQGAVRL